MNKAELIDYMAKETKLAKTECKHALEAIIKGIETTLKKGKNVVLTGFGTYSTMKRKERIGVNPATGAQMKIAAKRVPKFKPGKKLKDLVR
ncbi:MAG: HU family DNA-binding protein [bacterium]